MRTMTTNGAAFSHLREINLSDICSRSTSRVAARGSLEKAQLDSNFIRPWDSVTIEVAGDFVALLVQVSVDGTDD
jgi:hypothetical protein